MKNVLLTAVAASALLFVSAASAQDQPGHTSPAPGTTNDAASAVKDTAGHIVGDITAEMTTTLKGFVQAAAISDMYEVEAGKIAEDRAQNRRVRAFAAKMVKAHTETSERLKSILAGLGSSVTPVTPPAHLDDRRQGMIDELRGAKAADFDNRYLSQQIDAHKEALILMKGYAKDGDVAPVKAFASKTAPIVQSHLDMAEHLSNAGK
jgi:putative membrane protein